MWHRVARACRLEWPNARRTPQCRAVGAKRARGAHLLEHISCFPCLDNFTILTAQVFKCYYAPCAIQQWPSSSPTHVSLMLRWSLDSCKCGAHVASNSNRVVHVSKALAFIRTRAPFRHPVRSGVVAHANNAVRPRQGVLQSSSESWRVLVIDMAPSSRQQWPRLSSSYSPTAWTH
jgi:hypothetical protein